MAVSTTLVQIRERKFLDLLDLSIVVARRRPIVFGLSALAGVAPCVAFNEWVVWAWPDVPSFLLLTIAFWQIPWATAPLTVVMGGLMFGDRPSSRRVLLTLVRSLPPMLIFQGLIRAILMVTVILILIMPARLAFLNEVILLERGRWRDVIKRSSVLCGDTGGALLLRSMAAWFFGFLFVTSFRWGIGVLGMILTGTSNWDSDAAGSSFESFFYWLFDFRTPLAQVAIGITVAYFGIVRFLTYIDQRIRLEGWEVELRLKSAGAAIEESLKW